VRGVVWLPVARAYSVPDVVWLPVARAFCAWCSLVICN
jgi:hypothetical protein